jgi:transcriptional regulator GlxA family with amidase domain
MSLDPIRQNAATQGALSAFNRLVDFDAASLPTIIADLLRDARASARQDRLSTERSVRAAVDLIEREGRRLLEQSTPAPAPARGGLAAWQIRRIDAHMAEHIEAPLRVSDLAAIAKLSAGYFSKAFAQSYGHGPREHILQLRLERARAMMVESREPLGQIAAACGFADQAHLSTRFRKAYATTPNAWRRLNVGDLPLSAGRVSVGAAFA